MKGQLHVTVMVPQKNGVEFIVHGGDAAVRYEAQPSDLYVRVRVISPESGSTAWANPAYVVRD